MGRNSYQSTIAAPYGVRAFEDAPVVTPVSWEELGEPGTTARRYTIATVRQRLADRGDAWADMYASARPLPDSGATVESTA
jgi:bifunctional non-homologous end joining protein LigD